MAEDPYTVLGVSRDASDADINRAFKRLAKQYHPDLNPGDAGKAETFKKVTAANDIIGDPEKRRQFDRGEIDASGEPRRTYAHPGAGPGSRTGGSRFEDAGFTDFFSDLFGEGRRGTARGGFATRGRDIRYTLEVDFLEAVSGARKRVTLPDGGLLDISVPEGVTDGQVLRLKGKGVAGSGGGEAGDALVEVKVRPHPQFRREGDDILLDLPIGLDEAVLGGKVEVPTISGRVQVSIVKGTSSGRVLRLKGKGVRNLTTGDTGDQLVTVRIVLPETVDDELSFFIAKWRERHPYSPRKG